MRPWIFRIGSAPAFEKMAGAVSRISKIRWTLAAARLSMRSMCAMVWIGP